MENSDQYRDGSILSGLDSQFSLGHDQYPRSLIDAQNVIQNHTYDPEYKRKKQQKDQQRKEGKQNHEDKDDAQKLSFAQMRNVCWCCGGNHKLSDYRKKDTMPKDQWHVNQAKEVKQYQNVVAQIEATMNEQQESTPSSSMSVASTTTPSVASATPASMPKQGAWQFFSFAATKDKELSEIMILDSGSSTNLCCNPQWLSNVKPSPAMSQLHTNAGPIKISKQGTLPGYGTVLYHEDALTNIMSLSKMTDKYRVTFDSNKDNAFLVHTPEGIVWFGRNASGLYTHAPKSLIHQGQVKTNCSFVQTVQENMAFYTPREISRAKKARELLAILGFPSVADMKTAISMNAIADLPIKTSDVELAERIFGPDLGSVKGKTTRKKPLPMVSDQISIPPQLYESRDTLDLCIDIMFVNGMPFFTTITRALYYRTAQFLPTGHIEISTALLMKSLGCTTTMDSVLTRSIVTMNSDQSWTLSRMRCMSTCNTVPLKLMFLKLNATIGLSKSAFEQPFIGYHTRHFPRLL